MAKRQKDCSISHIVSLSSKFSIFSPIHKPQAIIIMNMDIPSPIQLLQLPSYFMPMGGEFCMDQSVALKKAGVDVSIVANVILPFRLAFQLHRYPLFPVIREENGIRVHRFFQRNIPKSDKANLQRWIDTTYQMISSYIQQYGKPDLIHAHSWQCAGYVCHLIKEKYQIPYVITEHSGSLNPRSNRLNELLSDSRLSDKMEQAYNHANAIIGVSNEVLDGIRTFTHSNVPMFSISNLIDVDFFSPPLTRVSHNEFVFSAANSNLPVKAYDILFEAFDLLCEQKENVRLRIAGNGFETRAGRQLIAQCIHHDKIDFLGWQSPEGVRQLLWEADAFVLSSCEESQSIAVLEAMSTGLPIVGTHVIPSEVLTPDVGYRVPINEPQLLATAMFNMINNHHHFEPSTIISHAHHIANPKRITEQLLSVYNTILQR
jgi:glycosyltransferase involved in cell wall biosynthesis